MQIIIKVLKGKDCTITAEPTTTIAQIKAEIEKTLQIPQESQKLLLLGRTLNDDQTISSYPSIKDGCKLNLIVKKADSFRDIIYRAFRKYYNEQHSESLTKEFMVEFDRKLDEFSMDDLERLVENITLHS